MRRLVAIGLVGLGLLVWMALPFFERGDDSGPGVATESRDRMVPVEPDGARTDARESALIHGDVMRRDGTPVNGCVLSAAQGANSARDATATAEGRFSIRGLTPGRPVLLTVAGVEMTPQPVVGLAPGEIRWVEVVLPAETPLVVRVEDELGRPVAGAEVSAYPRSAEDWQTNRETPVVPTPPIAITRTTGADGRIELHGLPGFFCLLVARHADHAEASDVVWLGGKREETTLVLRPVCTLEGRVLGTDGRGVAGAHVGFEYDSPTGARTVADADGNYRLKGLPAGERALLVARPGAALRPVAVVLLPEVERHDVVLPRAATIGGRVFEAGTGAPLAGATIGVKDHWSEAASVLTTNSRPDGSYEIAGLRPGFTRVSVELRGWVRLGEQEVRLTVVPGSRLTVAFPMIPASRIEGIVRNADGPVPGAEVQAWPRESAGWARTRSGPDGRYRLESLGAGLWALSVRAAWHLDTGGAEDDSLRVEIPHSGVARFDVTLERSGTRWEEFQETGDRAKGRVIRVTGRAITTDGAPAIGALVGVDSMWIFGPDIERVVTSESWRVVRVDANGRYALEVEYHGPAVFVQAFRPGFAPTDPVELSIERQRDDYEVDLVLGPGHGLVARVRDAETGAPIPDAAAAVVTPDSGDVHDHEFPPPAVHAVSADDGTLTIRRLPRGSFALRVSAPGYLETSIPVEIPRRGAVEVELRRAFDLGGVVRDETGSRLGPFEIEVIRVGDGERMARSETDRTGHFRVTGIPAGAYLLAFEADVQTRINILEEKHGPYEAGRTDLVVEVRAGKTISGRVVGGDGLGIAGATVTASYEAEIEDEDADPGYHSGWAFADKAGRFEIRGLFDLEYVLEVEANGFVTSNGTTIASGATDVRIVLSAGRSISGVLVDAEGRPIAGWDVYAVEPDHGGYHHSEDPMTRTDQQGRFTLTGLTRDAYEIALGSAHMGQRNETTVLTGAASHPTGATDVRVVAVEGAKVTGRVLDEDGKPLAGVEVEAEESVYANVRHATTDRDGRFTVTGLFHDRDCVLEIDEEDFVARKVPIGRPGRDPVEIHLVRGLEIRGRALGLDGKPIHGRGLSFRREGGGAKCRVATDAEGRFRARGLPAGRYRATAFLEQPGGEDVHVEFGPVDAGSTDVVLRARRR